MTGWAIFMITPALTPENPPCFEVFIVAESDVDKALISVKNLSTPGVEVKPVSPVTESVIKAFNLAPSELCNLATYYQSRVEI